MRIRNTIFFKALTVLIHAKEEQVDKFRSATDKSYRPLLSVSTYLLQVTANVSTNIQFRLGRKVRQFLRHNYIL